jgi:hypothetical protein
MADIKDLPLERSLERWEKCDPKVMAEHQSAAAIAIAFADAKHDIRALAREIERLRAQLAAVAQVSDEMVLRAKTAFFNSENYDNSAAMRAALEAALQGKPEGG